jgi:hypothetical protein
VSGMAREVLIFLCCVSVVIGSCTREDMMTRTGKITVLFLRLLSSFSLTSTTYFHAHFFLTSWGAELDEAYWMELVCLRGRLSRKTPYVAYLAPLR